MTNNFVSEVLQYMESKNKTIINNYRTPDGIYSEHCGLIALDIGKILLKYDLKPEIYRISEDILENGILHSKSLKPIIFNGKISWGSHQICCLDGVVYDPILSEPTPIDDYFIKVFGEKIDYKLLFSTEQIKSISK